MWPRRSKVPQHQGVRTPTDGVPDADGPAPAAWADLPPVARAVEPMRTIMGMDSFEAGLASRRAPDLLVGALSHALSPGAPSGMIHGIARVGPPPKPVHVGRTSPAAAPSPRSLRTVMRFPGRSSIPSIRGTAGSPEPAAAEPGPVAAPVAEPSSVGVEEIRVAPPPDQADVPLMTLGEPLVQP